jgi:hypothetical protein
MHQYFTLEEIMRINTVLTALLLSFALAAAAVGQQVVATGRGIQNPQMAVAGTGDFMIVWSDRDNGPTPPLSTGVFARLFDASGRPKGPAFLVHENRAGDQIQPQVAADERGNFVVVWQGGFFSNVNGHVPGGDGNGTGVFAQRFDRNGVRTGTAIRLSRSAAGDQLTPSVAMASDGSFVAVWQDCTAARRRCSELRVGRFTASGERRGEELEIPVLTASFFLDGTPVPNPTPHVAIEPDGFAVGWTEQEACYKFEYEKYPVVVHFTDSGQPVGERFRLDDGLCEDATGWILAALTASGTGASAAFFNGERNSFQLFGPDGDPAGSRKIVGPRNPCDGIRCESIGDAAMDSEGGFAVVWNHYSNTNNPPAFRHSLQVQFFDSAGRPLGKRIQVGPSPRELFTPAAAFANDGSLLLVWGEPTADNVSRRLLVRRIRRS